MQAAATQAMLASGVGGEKIRGGSRWRETLRRRAFGLCAGASSDAPARGVTATRDATQALGVLGLRWRLFDFGRVDAQIAAARGQEAEALAAYRLAMLRATEDVENALSTLVKREDQVGILTQGESSFARARENADAAYRGGVVSLIEVLDADSDLLQMRDAKAQAQTEAARAAIASFSWLPVSWVTRPWRTLRSMRRPKRMCLASPRRSIVNSNTTALS